MKLSAYYFGRMEQMGCKYGRLRKEGKYCAYCTKTDLRNQVIYSIYVRNYSEGRYFPGSRKGFGQDKGIGGRYHLVSANLPHRAGKAERHPWLTPMPLPITGK